MTSMSMTKKKMWEELEQVPNIWYLQPSKIRQMSPDLKKRSQYNKSSFHFLVRVQNTKN